MSCPSAQCGIGRLWQRVDTLRLANQIEYQTTVLWLIGRESGANPSLGEEHS